MSRTVKTVLVYFVIVTVAIMLVNAFVGTATAPQMLSLDQFQVELDAGHVASVVIKQKSDILTGDFTEGADTASQGLRTITPAFTASSSAWLSTPRCL